MNKIDLDVNNIVCPFSFKGDESLIYVYKDPSYEENVLLKYFRDEETEKNIKKKFDKNGRFIEYMEDSGTIITNEMRENKQRKLDMIDTLACFSDEIKILDVVFDNDKFCGYTMEKSPYRPINELDKKTKKIRYLKLIREKLSIFNANSVFIGDFNPNNFLVNKDGTDMKLCDLDNYRIEDSDFDIKHTFVQNFEKCCKKKEFIDSYCFNLFTIALLNKRVNDIEYILRTGLPSCLNTKENREIYDSIVNIDDSYQYKFLIDNIR